jgi:hypothetical protein
MHAILIAIVALLPLFTASASNEYTVVPPEALYDADIDGTPEFFEFDFDANGFCRVSVRSGETGDELFAVDSLEPYDLLGYAIASAGDLNSDGTNDLLISAPRTTDLNGALGAVLVINGDGTPLRLLRGPAGLRIGFEVTSIPDQDGDGVAELLVEAIVTGTAAERIRTLVFSGATGDLLIIRSGSVAATLEFMSLGGKAFLPADIDRDGDVDAMDLALLMNSFGPAANLPEADLNRDGVIDATDLYLAVASLGQSSIDPTNPGAQTELPPDYCQFFPLDPVCVQDDLTTECDGTGTGFVQQECSVAILNCPAMLVQDEQYTLQAHGLPPGGSYTWSTIAGAHHIHPNSGSGPNFSFVVQNLPFGGDVTVQVVYMIDDCIACATCTFKVPDPCRNVSVEFVRCESIVATNWPGELRARGYPGGGEYSWTVEYGHLNPTWVHGPIFQFVAGVPGPVRVRVDYTVHGCTKHAYCDFIIDWDDDEDGVPNSYECNPTIHSPDTDGDGYSDLCEIRLGTNPCDPNDFPDPTLDTDGDGLSDVREASIFFGPDWLRFDTDKDGVQDLAEIELGLNPRNRYSNGTTLDSWRPEYLAHDRDRDGLYDPFELKRGLDPTDSDMDRDGIPDGVEIRNGLNPLRPAWRPSGQGPDSDNDWLSDQEEQLIGTDPNHPDTDRDGIPDGLEVMMGLNPLSADSDGDGILDGDEDFDADGLTNFEELMYGTDPMNPDTDGDGVPDGQEVRQGSDPLDPNDSEPPPPDEIVTVRLTVGDPSGSHSEIWALQVGPVNLRAPGYGQVVGPREFVLRRGRAHEIRLIHLGSNMNPPDYDWFAAVEVVEPGRGWVDDPQNLLGNHNDDPTWPPKRATLYLPLGRIVMDSDRDGTVDVNSSGDTRGKDVWEYGIGKKGAIITVNNDDDAPVPGSPQRDCDNNFVDGPDDLTDLSPIHLGALGLPDPIPQGWRLRLSADRNDTLIRIFDAHAVGANEVALPHEFEIQQPWRVVAVEAIEYPDQHFNGLVNFTVELINPQNAVVQSDTVRARVAPWLTLSHNDLVQSYADVFVTNAVGVRTADPIIGTPAASSFPDRLASALGGGASPTVIHAPADRWTQDQFEIGFHSSPPGWKHVTLDSTRNRGLGLDGYVGTHRLSTTEGYIPARGGFNNETQNSLGNLETFPRGNIPMAWVAPHGMKFRGNGMTMAQGAFIDAQEPQPSRTFNTSWLNVEHVDEIISVLPTGASGFSVLVADSALGIQLMDADPAQQFSFQLWNRQPSTAADLLQQHRRVNEDARDALNALADALAQEGMHIIRVPVFFAGTFGTAVAALPDMVNLLNFHTSNGVMLIVPEPYSDPFKDAFVAAVAGTGAQMQWIDCLEYHWNQGQVHCGTNTRRTPADPLIRWWDQEPNP